MRNVHRCAAALALGALALAACRDRPQTPPPPPRPMLMLFVPKLPGSVVVDTTGTDVAERATMVVSVAADSVAAFYRAMLGPRGWRLVGDRPEASFVDLHATRGDGAALWIHIERQDPSSARYTIIASGARLSRGDSVP